MTEPTTKTPSLGRRALGMAWVTAISRLFGLVRSQFMAGLLGATALGDAFNIAFRFPNLMRRLFAEGAMSAGFVPVFTQLQNQGDAQATRLFLSRILTLLFLTLAALTLIVIAGAPFILQFYYQGQGGPPEATRPLSILLFRLMFPYLLFISLAAVLQGVLNAHGRFRLSAATPIVLNGIIILFALVYLALYRHHMDDRRAIYLALGVVVGGLFQFLMQAPAVIRLGYSLKPNFKLADPAVRRFITLVVPTVFSAGIYQLNAVLTDPLAVALGAGALSAINYSIRLQEFPLGLVVVSLATVSLPAFSKQVAGRQFEALQKEMGKALTLSSLVMFPVTLFSFLFGTEIIRLVYGMGAFDSHAVELTRQAFSFHIASILFIGFSRILTNVFYAFQDTRSPLYVSLLGLVVNVGSALLFTRVIPWGVPGIAMAGGLSALVMATAYGLILARRGHNPWTLHVLVQHGKMILAMIPVALLLLLIKQGFPNALPLLSSHPFWSQKLRDGLLITAAGLALGGVFATCLVLLKVEAAASLYQKVARRFTRKDPR